MLTLKCKSYCHVNMLTTRCKKHDVLQTRSSTKVYSSEATFDYDHSMSSFNGMIDSH